MNIHSWHEHRDAIECLLAVSVDAGRLIDYPRDANNEMPIVHAEQIRQLLLGRREAFRLGVAPKSGGVRIRGARIAGPLNLDDCAGSGEMLPALALEQCDITDEINLDGSRISRLSLKGSRFRDIKLREAEIGGPFDFSGCQPFKSQTGENEPAWIDARGAVINGQITGSAATLQLPPKRQDFEIEPEGPRFALWLAGADIRGSLRLCSGFTAFGGVSLDGAQVHGHVWCDRARLVGIEDDAFNAQSARIFGNLMLRSRHAVIVSGIPPDQLEERDKFHASGWVWLLGAQISGYLDLRYANIDRPAADNKSALVLDQADIGATLLLQNATIRNGHVSFVGTRLRGSLNCTGLRLLDLPRDNTAFIGSSMEIGDSADFDGASFEAPVDLAGAHVGGSLSFNGVHVRRAATGGTDIALNAVNINIAGSATFGACEPAVPGDQPRLFDCQGRIDLTGAKIAGDLKFEGGTLRNYVANGEGIALKAERAQIAGSVEFRDNFRAEGEIDLAGASVGQDLKCTDASFNNPCDAATYGSAIYAKDLQVGDDVQLINTVVDGNLRFERMQVTGSLRWDGLTIGQWRNHLSSAPLDLRHARIGSVLKAAALRFRQPYSGIDLRGAIASTVESRWPDGWGGVQAYAHGPECSINLDGFTYERLALSSVAGTRRNLRLRRSWNIPTGGCAPPANQRGDHLLDWVLHQPRQDDSRVAGELSPPAFFPHPFRQLARVLQAQGEEEAARTVTTGERWAAPTESGGHRLLRTLYGFFFGFGLSGTRANLTLLAYVVLGALGVGYAQSNNMLAENVVVTASAYIQPYDEWTERVFLRAPKDGVFEKHIACTDTPDNFLTHVVYALDMIVPFIPLHQESKCEIVPDQGTSATLWRAAKAGYSLLGWIVFSVWLVTFYSRLKRPGPEI